MTKGNYTGLVLDGPGAGEYRTENNDRYSYWVEVTNSGRTKHDMIHAEFHASGERRDYWVPENRADDNLAGYILSALHTGFITACRANAPQGVLSSWTWAKHFQDHMDTNLFGDDTPPDPDTPKERVLAKQLHIATSALSKIASRRPLDESGDRSPGAARHDQCVFTARIALTDTRLADEDGTATAPPSPNKAPSWYTY